MTDRIVRLDPTMFRVDGRNVTVLLGPDDEVALRQPTGGQWREVVLAYEQAEEKVSAVEHAAPVHKLISDDLPYAAAFAHLLGLLSTMSEPVAHQLPLWANDAGIFTLLHNIYFRAVVVETPPDEFVPIPDPAHG